jgi:hypothetical protein
VLQPELDELLEAEVLLLLLEDALVLELVLDDELELDELDEPPPHASG